MAQIPQQNIDIANLIDQYHEQRPDEKRWHLGCSLLGHHCDRWLWLSYRWAVSEKFPGRILRLFRRGQNEEAVIVSDLRAIGVEVVEHDGSPEQRQLRVDFGYGVSGSLDGVCMSGVPEAPTKPHVLELKTHSLKSFNDLVKNGVEKSKPMHYAQMQLYMLGMGLDRALYGAVCKDDDRYHFERIRFDKAYAEKLRDRGIRITQSDRMPEPCLGASPDWYQCKICPAHGFCFGNDQPDRNCRTCKHCKPYKEVFDCMEWEDQIPKKNQIVGCDSYEMHEDLIYKG